MDPTTLVLELARDAGFDLAGVAPLEPPPAAGRFREWLTAGHHADMGWLERQSGRILDPRRILEGGRSLLVVGLAHSRPALELEDGGRVARYAAGRDYHNAMGKALRKLGRRLVREGLVGASRTIVDAGPLLERSHAARAGLGFESKAANLLHPAFGPWFFLGELILDLELEPTGPPPAGSCGTCTACLDVCPTAAIREPGVLDARLCISYQTIENRGPIPRELRAQHGAWAFGCDLCSEVCPWGGKAPDTSARFGLHPAFEPVPGADPGQAAHAAAGLVSWIEAGEDFTRRFEGSPLRRPGREGLARNAAIALGNLGPVAGEEARGTLLRALSFDPAALVREAAAWGLARGWGAEPGVRRALEEGRRREPEGWARHGIEASLEGVEPARRGELSMSHWRDGGSAEPPAPQAERT